MSETCQHQKWPNVRDCEKVATHTVSADNENFQYMCLRHATKYVGFGYSIEKIWNQSESLVAKAVRDEFEARGDRDPLEVLLHLREKYPSISNGFLVQLFKSNE